MEEGLVMLCMKYIYAAEPGCVEVETPVEK
jgi:hypothetical protein